MFQFNNKSVAQVAADMLLMLADHVQVLLKIQPDLPHKIIEVSQGHNETITKKM